MARIERIGILTSGGDCAGLNAVIRAVVHRAVEGDRSLGCDARIGVGGDA
jgi:6-phosphofructokinase